MNKEELIIANLYKTWSGSTPLKIEQLPGSGSYRHYYRITREENTLLGVYNNDRNENIAFLSFTDSFYQHGFPVPRVFFADLDMNCYLIEDLGDSTLFSQIEMQRDSVINFPSGIVEMYGKVIEWLPQFQVNGSGVVNYRVCYPRAAFDRQSIMWDLNYFKYYFLKLAKVSFDEQKLEDDFVSLTDFLLEAGYDFFMYRDFQSRNIMIRDNQPWFIDYQGGRKGPLQYDIASLLYDAKAVIPETIREELLSEYLLQLGKHLDFDKEQFMHHYDGFVLVRILQALGAYGFRGYYENKPHFLQSIPFALENLKGVLERERIPIKIPVLRSILNLLVIDTRFTTHHFQESNLTISVFSFSYKHGIPADGSDNGGGFVFDCRALPNPGKFEEYQKITGKDQPVIDFLKKEASVDEFLNAVFTITDQSVKRYIERDFRNLMVSFGCTGGQHRSVYCAEQMTKHLQQKFPVKVILNHTRFESMTNP